MKHVPHKGLVLDAGPSDHRPLVKDLWYVERPDAPPVRIGFWNVNHATNAKRARPTFDHMRDLGVDVLILNEVKPRGGIIDLLGDDFGYGVRWHAPEYAIAWDRSRFAYKRMRPLVMSEHDYWLERNEALAVVLHDRDADSDMRAISQHPPAHIARKKHATFDNVLAVHRDIGARNARIGHHSRIPVVIGRDSNIDPLKDHPVYTNAWGWAYPKSLDYVRAPDPTHHSRHIDELLTKGLRAEPHRR